MTAEKAGEVVELICTIARREAQMLQWKNATGREPYDMAACQYEDKERLSKLLSKDDT